MYGVLIDLSSTEYLNKVLGMYWLRHFNTQTLARRQGAWRLLIFDGHISHLSYEFVSFCEAQNIVPFCLPPHSTHLLQPLDITVFQPFKHYHSQAIEHAVRNGDVKFSNVTFLAAFQTIHDKTFKQSTILSAFKNAGLVSFNPFIVFEKMKQLEPTFYTSTPEVKSPNMDFFLIPYILIS